MRRLRAYRMEPAIAPYEVLAGIDVLCAEAHCVVEQHGDLARSGSDRLCLADPGRKPSVEGAESGGGTADRGCGHPQKRGDPVRGLAGVCRENLAAADLATRGKR